MVTVMSNSVGDRLTRYPKQPPSQSPVTFNGARYVLLTVLLSVIIYVVMVIIPDNLNNQVERDQQQIDKLTEPWLR